MLHFALNKYFGILAYCRSFQIFFFLFFTGKSCRLQTGSWPGLSLTVSCWNHYTVFWECKALHPRVWDPWVHYRTHELVQGQCHHRPNAKPLVTHRPSPTNPAHTIACFANGMPFARNFLVHERFTLKHKTYTLYKETTAELRTFIHIKKEKGELQCCYI